MKVGILTITDGANYGNRLQNYAMQQLLETLNIEVETIQRRTSRDKNGIKKIKVDLKYFIKRLLGYSCDQYRRLRKKRFNEFNTKYVKFSRFILKNNKAPQKLKGQFDYFIIGSDQVWNTRFDIIQEDIKNHLAAFADPNQKISYAASFGTNDILPEHKHIFAEELPKFKSISVRETSGVGIIKNICGREDATVVLDPTMMLSRTKWEKIAEKPDYIKDEKFIVTYFLGGRGEKIDSYIKKLEKRYNCRAINLEIEFLDDDKIVDPRIFVTTPNEFVWLMKNAQCVLTDSFHATVFAIIFNKPFCVFERKASEKGNNMGSRIETLLSKFELLNFRDDIENPMKIPQEYADNKVQHILKGERRSSMQFLENALDIRN